MDQILNPKHQILNNFKYRTSNGRSRIGDALWNSEHFDLFRVSKLGFRIYGVIGPLIFLVLFLTATNGVASEDSGTFRAKWWNYYGRGVTYSENGDWPAALKELKKAVSMRDKDQRMARTYGMHFIDYFPHRELGVVHYFLKEYDKAIKELEQSLRSVETSKAIYYLNKARKEDLLLKGSRGQDIAPPTLTITSPAEGTIVGDFTAKVKGTAKSDGLVSAIRVNGSPVSMELAQQTVHFETNVEIAEGENTIAVTTEDLVGRQWKTSFSVFADREGPVINISQVQREHREGKDLVRITGEVDDASGIGDVTIGTEKRSGNGAKTHRFDLTFERRNLPTVLMIQTVDIIGNETAAGIDVEQEVAAFSRKPAPIMLASSGGTIFSSDKEPPAVNLREAKDASQTQVFVDKYYVDGDVSDNKQVERVVLNGKEIAIKKGKKIFFSKLIALKEGDNRITLDAYDSSDNKSSVQFTVKRVVPEVMQNSHRMSLTLLPFEGDPKGSAAVQIGYDFLTASFTEQKRFRVLERAKLQQVLLEQKLTADKLTDPTHSIRVGKLMAADAIVATSARECAKSVEVISRVINTETSEVMEVKDVFSEDKSNQSLRDLMEGLASKLARSFPVVEGIVINRDKNTVYTDLGTKNGVKKEQGIIIYRRGKEMKHPVTGRSLGFDTVRLGEGRVEEVGSDFTKASLSEKSKIQEIKTKDLVVTK